MPSIHARRSDAKAPRSTRLSHWFIVMAAIALEAAGLWLRARRLGGSLVVRCRRGHLFTTLWIPGVSLKALRLGWWRIQRCPVGRHVSIVTPVRESDLDAEERREAARHRDLRIP